MHDVPVNNVEGSKRAVFCRQHAEDGMLDARNRRCSYDSCTTRPLYNVECENSPLFCKQHAEGGMVNVGGKRCSYNSCTKNSSYNVDGVKPALYCKTHADDGIIIVCGRRCTHGSGTKNPGFNLEGIRLPMHCKRHAEIRMIDMRGKRCVYDGCKKYPGIDVQGSCRLCWKSHAEDDMVDLRNERVWNESRAERAPNALLSRPMVCPLTRQYRDVAAKGIITGTQRARLALDKSKALPCPVERTLIQGKVVQPVVITPSEGAPIAISSGAPSRHPNYTMIPTAVGRALQEVPFVSRPLTKEQQLLSSEPIKIELELTN